MLFFLVLLVISLTIQGENLIPDDPHDPRAVLLTSIPSLLFTNGMYTIPGGRTQSVPQMTCISHRLCDRFMPNSILCNNIGTDYTTGDPIWSCQAELATGIRLGRTDISCEGFRTRDDPYILRGSCSCKFELKKESDGYDDDFGAEFVIFLIFVFICVFVALRSQSRSRKQEVYQIPIAEPVIVDHFTSVPNATYVVERNQESNTSGMGGVIAGGIAGYALGSILNNNRNSNNNQHHPSTHTSTSFASSSRRDGTSSTGTQRRG
jgi:uncharacterized protein (DUF983 family)